MQKINNNAYLVRTVAGFKAAVKDYSGEWVDREVLGWPTSYPSLVTLYNGYTGYDFIGVTTIHVNKLAEIVEDDKVYQQKVNLKMKDKTLHNSSLSVAKVNVPDLKVFGDGDLFRLLSKASSASEGWMKSTKAMQTPIGVIIQVTTQQKNPDGSYSLAEALTTVEGVELCLEGEVPKLVAIGDVTGTSKIWRDKEYPEAFATDKSVPDGTDTHHNICESCTYLSKHSDNSFVCNWAESNTSGVLVSVRDSACSQWLKEDPDE